MTSDLWSLIVFLAFVGGCMAMSVYINKKMREQKDWWGDADK